MSELDRKAIWQPPPRPDWVTRINAEGNCMNIRGVVPLDENSLLDTAMRNTGLSNFGSEEWREPFKVFVKSLDEEAELNLMGRLMGRSDILLFLEARLRIWSHRDPVKAFASGVDLLGTLQWVRSDHPLKSGVENMMNIEGAAATRSLRRISAQRRLAGLAALCGSQRQPQQYAGARVKRRQFPLCNIGARSWYSQLARYRRHSRRWLVYSLADSAGGER